MTIPYPALIAADLDGLLVAGRCIKHAAGSNRVQLERRSGPVLTARQTHSFVRTGPDLPYPGPLATNSAGDVLSGDFVAHSSYRVTGNAVPMGEAAGRAAAISIQKLAMPHELEIL